MEKLYRWVAQHVWPVYIGALLFSYFLLMLLTQSLPLWVQDIWPLVWFAMALRFLLWVFRCGYKLFNQPLAVLENQCDPDPYLEEARRQQSYPGPANLKLSRTCILAMALFDIGEYEQGYHLLTAVPKKTVCKVHPVNQISYFSSLFWICVKLEKNQEAEISHLKLMEAYSKIRLKKRQKMLEPIIESHHSGYLRFKQEYTQALLAIKARKNPSLRSEVLTAGALAGIYQNLGEKGKAIEQLEFVINNGNKLYIVTEAKELLAKINSEE
jgi:hypothetical protein